MKDPALDAIKAAKTATADPAPAPRANEAAEADPETGVEVPAEAEAETGVEVPAEAEAETGVEVPAEAEAEDPDDNAPAPEVEPVAKTKRVRSAPPVKPVSKTSDIKLAAVVAKRRADKSKMTSDHQSAVDWLFRRR